jgi:hypothetical protein
MRLWVQSPGFSLLLHEFEIRSLPFASDKGEDSGKDFTIFFRSAFLDTWWMEAKAGGSTPCFARACRES